MITNARRESGRGLPQSETLRDLREQRSLLHALCSAAGDDADELDFIALAKRA
jgi:hypothetical protein